MTVSTVASFLLIGLLNFFADIEVQTVEGCTDPIACNYNPSASVDDGSCDFCSCQSYSMAVEEYATDGIPGHTTYRFYINMVNEDDFLSAVGGNDDRPFNLQTSEGFYNDGFASGSTADGVNPAFYSFFPSLAYDSWVTIGIEQTPTPAQTAISCVESSSQPWIQAFNASSPLSGQDIEMSDVVGGWWYVLNGTPNGLPDEFGRVLFMQLTTTGDFWGTINLQVFVNGQGANQELLTISFDGPGEFFPSGVTENAHCGCVDELACNFDIGADFDDGSCIYAIPSDACDCSGNYPEEGYDCAGNCLSDADGDGICDAFEGCTDTNAVNFDPNALDDDGSCIPFTNGLALQGIMDLTVPDGSIAGKAIHLVATQDIPNLSYYGLGVANNGQGTDGVEYVFPAQSIAAGSHVLVAQSPEAISSYFGECFAQFDEVFQDLTGAINQNGDDAIELFEGGVLTEVFGDADVDGTGEPWEYTDSWAYKVDGTWVMGGVDCSDLGSTTQESNCVYPFCDNFVWVEFAIDMTASIYPNDEYNMVMVNGNWDGWSGNGLLLNDDDNDGIWTGGIQLESSQQYQFVISVVSNPFFGWSGINLTPSGSCAFVLDGSDATSYHFIASEEMVVSYCAGTCLPAGACDELDAVTFKLDASNIGADLDVFLQAEFDDWNYPGAAMMDTDGDGAYSITVENVPIGDWHYRFVLDGEWEELNPNDPCVDIGASGDFYRLLNYPGGLLQLPAVCWESCVGCPVFGCLDEVACNYDSLATHDDGSCDFPESGYDCDGFCVNDADFDGVCDEFELPGCTDPEANNFSELATDDDGSCELVYNVSIATIQEAQLSDSFTGQIVVTSGVVTSNFGPLVSIQDGSGPYSGIWIYEPNVSLMVGDGIEVTAIVNEYFGVTQLISPSVEVISQNNPLPEIPILSTNAFADEQWEGVLVSVIGEVVDYEGPVALDDGSGLGLIGDLGFNVQSLDDFQIGSTWRLTGPINFEYGTFKIEPRAVDDALLFGCTNDSASNYNPSADLSDGSCSFSESDCSLIFSEWCEGSGNNRYIEIFNATGDAVHLGQYVLGNCSNGCDVTNASSISEQVDYWTFNFPLGAIIQSGGIYVVAHPSAAPEILDLSDTTFSYLSNGDDTYVLARRTALDTLVVDQVGTIGPDPGSGWEIAGITNATQNHTLIRKPSVSSGNGGDFLSSAGTNEFDSEWIVLEINDFSGLGSHSVDGICAGSLEGCSDELALNFNPNATIDDGSCVYVPNLTIEEIHQTGMVGPVITSGIVTGVYPPLSETSGYASFVIQNGTGAQSGIWVLGDGVAMGDEVEVMGTVYDSYGLTLLQGETIEMLSSGNALPAAEYMSTGELSTNQWESVLVQVEAELTDAVGTYGEWQVDDGSGMIRVKDHAYIAQQAVISVGGVDYPLLEQGASYRITGPNFYSYGSHKLMIRFATDVVRIGCTDSSFENYDFLAQEDDGSCSSFVGCLDESACNFNNAADDGVPCYYPESGYDCEGACLNDVDLDGICDEFEIAGCQEETACNYNPFATDSDDSCAYAEEGADCDADQAIVFQVDLSQTEVFGDVTLFAEFNEWGYPGLSMADTDGDGIYSITVQDVPPGEWLYRFGNDGVLETLDPLATCVGWINENFVQRSMTYVGGYVELPAVCWESCGLCLEGCTDPAACNYDPNASIDDASCTYAETGYDCDGVCLNDADLDGICDEFEVLGCTDSSASNYLPAATTDDGSCVHCFGEFENYTLVVGGSSWSAEIGWRIETAEGIIVAQAGGGVVGAFTACPAGGGQGTFAISLMSGQEYNFIFEDCYGDGWNGGTALLYRSSDNQLLMGSVDSDLNYSGVGFSNVQGNPPGDLYVYPFTAFPSQGCGCTNPISCNYAPEATIDDGSCEILGCLDPEACNYDPCAIEDDGTCAYYEFTFTIEGSYMPEVSWQLFDELGDAVHTSDGYSYEYPYPTIVEGLCMDSGCYTFTIYDSWGNGIEGSYAIAIGGIEFAVGGGNFGSSESTDFCTDGPGCTDVGADNYSPLASEDDGSCFYVGCMADWACNYDPIATVGGICIAPGACNCDFSDTDGDGLLDCVDPCSDQSACNYLDVNPQVTACDYSCICQDEMACNYGLLNDVNNTFYVLIDGIDAHVESGEPLWVAESTDGFQHVAFHTMTELFETSDTVCWSIQSLELPNYLNQIELLVTLLDGQYGYVLSDTLTLASDVFDSVEFCTADYFIDPCSYPDLGFDCDGNCISDVDGDGICDQLEIAGCLDAFACNFDAMATDEDGSCWYAEPSLDCEGNCLSGDNDGDGICNEFEPPTCGIAGACNYDPFFVENDASLCTFPGLWEDCEGNCLLDIDGDGVCDPLTDYLCEVGRMLEVYEGSFAVDWCDNEDPEVDFRVLCAEGIWNVDWDSTGSAFLEWEQAAFEDELTGIVAGSKSWGGMNLLMGVDRSGHPVPLLFCPETGGYNDPFGFTEFVPTPTDGVFTEIAAMGQAFVGITEGGELAGWGFTEPEFAMTYPPYVEGAVALFYRDQWSAGAIVLEGNDVVPWGGAFQLPFISVPSYIANQGLQIVDLAMTEQNGWALMEDGTMRSWGTFNAGMTVIPSGLDPVISLDFNPQENFLCLLQSSGKVQTMGMQMMRIPDGLLTNVIDVRAHNDKVVALRGDGRVISMSMQLQDGQWVVANSKEFEIPNFQPVLCIPGCTDELANNYMLLASEDDGSCFYGCQDDDFDGVCNADEVFGCAIASACNFNPLATEDNGTCYFANEFEDCLGNCSWESVATGSCGNLAGLVCNQNSFAISPGSNDCNSARTAYVIAEDTLNTGLWSSPYDLSALPDLSAVFVEPTAGQVAWIDADGFTGGMGSCNGLVVPQIGNAVKIDMEQNHGVILRANGTVASFAPSSAYDALEQTPIIFNYSVLDACSGEDFNLAVDGSQNILYWGIPNFSLQNDYAEVPHAGGFVQVEAFGHVAAAITEYGELVVWGDDSDGLVSGAPNSVTDAVAVVLGDGFAVVLHENGDVTQWGTNSSMPAPPTGLGNVVELDASADQVLALIEDGTFVSWGIQSLPSEGGEYVHLGTIEVPVEFCIPGCTDPEFHNYDPVATIDDGSCNNIGCTVDYALNYEPWAEEDDGSCIILGCTDPIACNYNPDAQYGLRVDVVAQHEGMVGLSDLNGFTTYRIILTGPNASDRLSAVQGDVNTPVIWEVVDGVIWQELLAGDVIPNISTNFFAFIPELNFDSWVTIGVDPLTYSSSEPVLTVESAGQPWTAAFEGGEGIVMNDNIGGAWFVAGAQYAGVFGDDHEVLLAQITTNGLLNIESMNIQVLPASLDSDDVLLYYQSELHECHYSDEVVNCNGECINDDDGDGVCDELEIEGCTNALACNYDPLATDDDGSCEVFDQEIQLSLEPVFVHEGSGELGGRVTYRLYADMHNADERVSAVVGYDEHPLLIQQGSGLMYQNEVGGITPSPLTPNVVSAFPNSAYDSYIALGIGHEDLPTSVQVLSSTEDWGEAFEGGLPIEINSNTGGGWFSTSPNDGLPSGPNYRVLLGQFTTFDGLQGQLSIQYFDCNGNEQIAYDLLFASDQEALGCMDDAACNFNASATIDDGTCCYSSCAQISGYSSLQLVDVVGGNPVQLIEMTESEGITTHHYCLAMSCYQVLGTEPSNVVALWDGSDVSEDVIDFGYLGSPSSPCVGCNDDGACNYENTVIIDDGSCQYVVGDFNGDLVSSVVDMLILLSEFDECGAPQSCVADIDGSGAVSVGDLLIFLSYFGTSCDG